MEGPLTETVLAFEFREPGWPIVDLTALVEALLLAAPGPTTVEDLAYGAGARVSEIERVVANMTEIDHRGWVVQSHGRQVQLATAPRFAPHVRRFLGLERESRLSNAALETLAIIAYQQPVTRTAIEAVRGVDSTGVLAKLLSRGLIESNGRSDSPGQPFEYETTVAFLRHFGLQSLDELPDLGALDGVELRQVLESKVDEVGLSTPGIELIGTLLSPVDLSGEPANS